MSARTHATPPSSGTTGFFQETPRLRPTHEEDEAWQRVCKFYLPSHVRETVQDDLANISRLALSPGIAAWCHNAETQLPSVRQHDTWGRSTSELITSEGWRNLQTRGQIEGMVAIGHDRAYSQYSRVYQFLKYHIWTPISAFTLCPAAMTDGAARLLYLQLQKRDLSRAERITFQSAYDNLISRDADKAWTSGQWMTERSGGSDVRGTETQATYDSQETADMPALDVGNEQLGPWSISGFKWFSSATDANATVLLAKEPSGAISAFFAPTRRRFPNQTETMNGISIQKLKNKLGTKALPTAELVLNDMRAWRIGASGQGVKNISTLLNITRLHNAVSAVACWSRGLAISRSFARVRASRGILLANTPPHVRTMASQHVEYRAMMHLAFLTAALLGADENASRLNSDRLSAFEASGLVSRESAPHLLRIVTPLAKMLTAKAAIAGLQECMESLGGVGYLENEDISFNIARLYRDCNVLSIWEGTTNIMADDVVRIVKGPSSANCLRALDDFVESAVHRWRAARKGPWAEAVWTVWADLRNSIAQQERVDLLMNGRSLSADLGWIVCAVLLGEDALSDQDAVAIEICSRWISARSEHNSWSLGSSSAKAEWDRRIVFGEDRPHGTASKL